MAQQFKEEEQETGVRSQRERGISVSWWFITTALAFALILGIGGLYIFRILARPLALLVLGVSIAVALEPVVERLNRRIPRILSVILVYLSLFGVMFGIVGSTIPILIQQTRGLIESSEDWLPRVTGWLTNLGLDASSLSNALTSVFSQAGSFLLSLPVNIASGFFELVLVFFFSLYWLLTIDRIKAFALTFFPENKSGFVSDVLARLGGAMGGYIRGSAINALIVGIISYIGLMIIGVPYALVLAAIGGLLEFLPTIGPIAAGGLATLVAFSISPTTALIVLVFMLVMQQLESNILVPVIMRSQTEISPLLSLFAVLAGASVGGLLGALVAIPLAAGLQVFVQMVIAPAVRRANQAD
ncbi:MAG: AI-2E family transporter [Chloroflexi bacterium]|nr:AI-2E family transporter [Chloroflexota bacterium]